MSCTVDSHTAHVSIVNGVLVSDVQYQWGPDVASAATILAAPGSIYRMHQVTGTTDVKAIGAPTDGDHSSRVVTLYGASGGSGTQFVLKNQAVGGNLKIKSGHDFGLYPSETMTFAWHPADGFWWEIGRSVQKIVGSNVISSSTTVTTGSEGAPAAQIITLPATNFDGASSFEFNMTSGEAGTTAGGNASIALYKDGTSIGTVYRADQANNGFGVLFVRAWVTPPAGLHTYAFKCWASAGSFSALASGGGFGNFFPITATIKRIDT